MSHRFAAVIAVLACFAVAILTACGSDDSGSGDAAATSAETTAAPAPAGSDTTPPASTSTQGTTDTATVVTRCHKTFDPIIAQIHKIEKMVDGTPRFGTYRAATDKLAATYAAFDTNDIPSQSCLSAVSIPTTNAAFTHIGVTKTWTECRKRKKCSKDMAKFEKQWRDASKLVVKADKGFATVTPD